VGGCAGIVWMVGGNAGAAPLVGVGGAGWAEALRANSDVTRNAFRINFISILFI